MRKRPVMLLGPARTAPGYCYTTESTRCSTGEQPRPPDHCTVGAGRPTPQFRGADSAIRAAQQRAALPWSAEVLLGHACALPRPDLNRGPAAGAGPACVGPARLLDRCGLSAHRGHWLRLVYAARRMDVPAVVTAAGGAPAPGTAARSPCWPLWSARWPSWTGSAGTRPGLAAYAETEPTRPHAAARLGLDAGTVRKQVADLSFLANQFPCRSRWRGWPPRGRCGVHPDRCGTAWSAAGSPPRTVTPSGPRPCYPAATWPARARRAGRPGRGWRARRGSGAGQRPIRADIAYLLARTAPGQLTDEQAAAVGHHAEVARRALLRADPAAVEALPDSPIAPAQPVALGKAAAEPPAGHFLEDLLPPYRKVAHGLSRSWSRLSLVRRAGQRRNSTTAPRGNRWSGSSAWTPWPDADASQRFPRFCEWLRW